MPFFEFVWRARAPAGILLHHIERLDWTKKIMARKLENFTAGVLMNNADGVTAADTRHELVIASSKEDGSWAHNFTKRRIKEEHIRHKTSFQPNIRAIFTH